MSYNFHIGQDVVALKDHDVAYYKKDSIYNIYALTRSNCNCAPLLDIGCRYNGAYNSNCPVCNTNTTITSGIIWFCTEDFAPLDELTDISELQEVLEQPLFQVK